MIRMGFFFLVREALTVINSLWLIDLKVWLAAAFHIFFSCWDGSINVVNRSLTAGMFVWDADVAEVDAGCEHSIHVHV